MGRGHHVVFTPSMHQRAVNRFALVQELRHALQAGEISMHYQPIADLATGAVVGFESLMRWRHPERGWVPPNEFIPLAEQSDLIVELGAFALRAAVTEASTWRERRPRARAVRDGQPLGPPVPRPRPGRRSSPTCSARAAWRPSDSWSRSPSASPWRRRRDHRSVIDQPHPPRRGRRPRRLRHGLLLALVPVASLNPRIIKIDQSFVRPAEDKRRSLCRDDRNHDR